MEPVYLCKYDELVSAETLRPHPKNPNTHPEDQMEALVSFIQFTGWRHAVIVSRLSGFVVVGHGRVEAGKRLGCLIPVVYQEFKDDAEELSFVLADNRLAELAYLDDELLAADLSLLEELDVDMSMLGFDVGEIIEQAEQRPGHSTSGRWGRLVKDGTEPKRVAFHFGGLQATYPEETYDAFAEAVQAFKSLDDFVDGVIKEWGKNGKRKKSKSARGRRKVQDAGGVSSVQKKND